MNRLVQPPTRLLEEASSGQRDRLNVEHAHADAGRASGEIHEALMATLIIFAFSVGVVSVYVIVLFACGQAKGIL